MKYIQTLILATLMTSPAALHAAPNHSDGSRLTPELQKAERLLQRHRYEDAIRVLEEGTGTAAMSFEELRLLASAHLGLGHYSEAIAAADSMLKLAKSAERSARAQSALGLALFQKSVHEDRGFHSSANRVDRVLAAWRSLEESGDPMEPLRQLVEGKGEFETLQQTSLEEAAAAFQQAIELGGDSFVLESYLLAEVLTQLARLEEARVELDRYFELAEATDIPLGPRELRCHLDSGALDRSTEGLVPPHPVDQKSAKYTSKAARRKFEGSVFLEGVIDTEGKVRCLRPLKGLPLGLTRQAMKAVEASGFEPARLEGEPVAVTYSFSVSFQAGYGGLPPAAEIQRRRRMWAQ